MIIKNFLRRLNLRPTLSNTAKLGLIAVFYSGQALAISVVESRAVFEAEKAARLYSEYSFVDSVGVRVGSKLKDRLAPVMGPTPSNAASGIGIGSIVNFQGLSTIDYVGRPLGYCSWDVTSASDTPTNPPGGILRYAGQTGNAAQLIFAVVSSGRNGVIQTNCSDILSRYNAGNTDGLGSEDDIVYADVSPEMASSLFRSSVADIPTLNALVNPEEGEIRFVNSTNRFYSYVGGSWTAVSAYGSFVEDSPTELRFEGTVTVNDFNANNTLTVGGTTTLNGDTSIDGNLTVTSGVISGSGSGLTDLNASNVSSGTLNVARGGTGVDGAAAANGSLLIGNGSGYSLGTLTTGQGVAVFNGAGTIQIQNTGVLSITGSPDQVIADVNNGAVFLSLPQAIATTSTPEFGGMTLNGALSGTSATFSGPVAASRIDVSSGGVTTPNVIVGTGAMPLAQSGAGGNTVLGYQAMASNTTGSHNTAVGYQADVTAANLNYASTLGAYSLVSTSDTLVLGALGANKDASVIDDQVVIGATARDDTFANTRLYVNGVVNVAAGLYVDGQPIVPVTKANIDSALTFADDNPTFNYGDNLGLGVNALSGASASTGNLAIGANVLANLDSTGGNAYRNTGLGNQALSMNVTGNDNTATGEAALFSNTTGSFNTASGQASLYSNTSGQFNSALGQASLFANTTGSRNTAIGQYSLGSNTTGGLNTATGASSLASNTSGEKNTAAGQAAMFSNTIGYNNAAFGEASMFSNTSGYENSAFGQASMFSNSTGRWNSAVGNAALFSNTTGEANAALGQLAMFSNEGGRANSGLGYSALASNIAGSFNVGLGAETDVATASLNYAGAIGAYSLVSTSNTIVLGALGANKDGVVSSIDDQVVIGATARDDTYANTLLYINGNANLSGTLYADNVSIATALTAPRLDIETNAGVTRPNLIIGVGAMSGAQSGDGANVAVGPLALSKNSTGADNIALGRNALRDNTSGNDNTAIGGNAMLQNDTGADNTAVGSNALRNNTVGARNVAVGNLALNSNTTGEENTALGSTALFSNLDGLSNTAVGRDSMRLNTSGTSNTAIGQFSLYDNTTGSLNTGVGYRAGVQSSGLNYASAFGAHAYVSTSNTLVLGGLGSDKNATYSSVDDQVVIGAYGRNDTYGNTKLYVNGVTFVDNNLYVKDAVTATAGAFSGAVSASRIDVSNSDGVVTPNVIVGTGAMPGPQTGPSGSPGEGGNAVFGNLAMYSNTEGAQNTGIGSYSLYTNTTGSRNTAVGYLASYYSKTADRNTAVGYASLLNNEIGYRNTALGTYALFYTTTGNNNTAIGEGALLNNSTGSGNTSLGQDSMTTNKTGSFNTTVGYFSNVTADNLTYATAIGANSSVSTSNTVVLGRGGFIGDQVVIGDSARFDAYGANTRFFVSGVSVLGGNTYIPTGPRLYFGNNNENSDAIYFERSNPAIDNSDLTLRIGDNDGTAGAKDHFYIVGGTGNLTVRGDGQIFYNGAQTHSDRRLKSDIVMNDTDDVLDRLTKLNSYTYRYNTYSADQRKIGVIAQEVLPLFPEAVIKDAKGYYSVDYGSIGVMAAAGVGRLHTRLTAVEGNQQAQIERLDSHQTRLDSLEHWREVTKSTLGDMQSAIESNIVKITDHAARIATNEEQLVKLEDVLNGLQDQVDSNGEEIKKINERWRSAFSIDDSTNSLIVNVDELRVNNLSAREVQANSVYAERLEAEIARIKQLEVDELQAKKVTTGTKQIYVPTGSAVTLFSTDMDGHYTVTTSANDGSFATATLVVSGGQAKVITNASEGIEILSFGNAIQLKSSGKLVKASWLKTG